MAAGGADSVSVEGLARTLGVTKGSFYWHFTGRADLVARSLALWEEQATAEIVDRLSAIPEPVARLRALFAESFGREDEGLLDTALVARSDDPEIGPVVRRVTAARLRFVTTIFRQLGLGPRRAERQARIAYAAYVGHFHLRRTLPADGPAATVDKRYLDQLLSTLNPPPGAT